jgi:hypothetical protein
MMLPPLIDMLVFPVLFRVAYRFRNRPETHKRLMVVATTLLLVAAVGRMSFLGRPPALQFQRLQHGDALRFFLPGV